MKPHNRSHFGVLSISLPLFFFTIISVPAQSVGWSLLTSVGPPTPELHAVHFFSRSRGFVCGRVGGNGRLYRTTDSGMTWTAVALPGSPKQLNDLSFPDSSGFGTVVGDDGYVATTDDFGASWVQRSLASAWPTGGDVQGAWFVDSVQGFVVGRALSGSGPRFAATVNGGATWSNIEQSGAANNLYDITFFDHLNGVAVGTGRLSRKSVTSDGGTIWESNGMMSVGYAVDGDSVSLSMYGVSAVPGTSTAFAAGGKVYYPAPVFPEVRRTTDYGATWQPTSLAGPGSGYSDPAHDVIAVSVAVAFVSTDNGGVYRTSDGGSTWRPESLPPPVGSKDLSKFSRLRDGTLFLVGARGTVLRFDARPDLLLSVDTVHLGALCPEETRTLAIEIRNRGTTTLTIDSMVVVADSSDIEMSLVGSIPYRIAAGLSDSIVLAGKIGMTRPPGTYHGTLAMYSDDAANGRDTVRYLPIVIQVPERSLQITKDLPLPVDMGVTALGNATVRVVDRLLSVPGPCPSVIDSVRFAIGREFSVSLDRSIWEPGRFVPLTFTFGPVRSCERYDTLLMYQNGSPTPLRVPLVGIGIESGYRSDPADTLDIGAAEIGTSRTEVLRLLNGLDGACLDTVRIRSFRILEKDGDIFSTPYSASATDPDRLAPGEERPVQLTATPSRAGVVIGHVEIEHDNALDTVALKVRGLLPELTASDTEIDFSLTPVGGWRDTALTDFLINLSSADVRLTGATIVGRDSSAFRYRGPSGVILPKGTRTTLEMRFAPTTSLPPNGEYEAELEVTTDIPSTLRFPLRGAADFERMETKPTAIVFDSVPIRSCHDSLVRHFIRNIGRVPLTLDNLSVVGDDSVAFECVTPTEPTTVLPGDSLSIVVRFCPRHLGVHQARLVVHSGAESSPSPVMLSGIGIENPITGIDSVQFASTRLGNVRERTVERLIVNGGIDPISVTTAHIVGIDSAVFSVVASGLPKTLLQNGRLDLVVRYAPSRRGISTARLNLATSLGPISIPLAGFCTYPQLVVTASGNGTDQVRVGTSAKLVVTVVNQGDDTARIERMAVAPNPAFVDPEVPSLPTVLYNGDTVTAHITFVPRHLCEDTLFLELLGEGIGSRIGLADSSVPIVGIGTGTAFRPLISALDFGGRTVGSTVDSSIAPLLINSALDDIYDRCVVSTQIDSIRIEGADADRFGIIYPGPSDLPQEILPGESFSGTIRFVPDRPGEAFAMLAIYFDGVADSVRYISLHGVGIGVLRADLGEDQTSAPGETIRVPIRLEGPSIPLDSDSLLTDLSFGATLLKPVRVITTDSNIRGTLESESSGSVGHARLRLSGLRGLSGNSLAEIEFLVLLGDRLYTTIGIDSIAVPDGSLVHVLPDTVGFTLSDFCDATGRLIHLTNHLKLTASSPVVGDQITINFTLPSEMHVHLELYDDRGHLVLTAADGTMSGGSHYEIVDTGELSQGVYYCLLTTDRFSRMIPLRVLR